MIIKNKSSRNINTDSISLLTIAKSQLWAIFYTSSTTPATVNFTTKMPAGESIFFNFGEGDGEQEVVGTGSDQVTGHTYDSPEAGTKITISGDHNNIQNLKYFSCYYMRLTGYHPDFSGFSKILTIWLRLNLLTGPIKPFAGCGEITNIWHRSTPFTGQIPQLAGFSTLTEVWMNDGGYLSGYIPSLSDLPYLKIAYFNDNQITGFEGGFTAELSRVNSVDFNAANNLLTATAINLILSSAVAVNFGTGDKIIVNGTGNAAPTGQGITDKATLIANGCSVITN